MSLLNLDSTVWFLLFKYKWLISNERKRVAKTAPNFLRCSSPKWRVTWSMTCILSNKHWVAQYIVVAKRVRRAYSLRILSSKFLIAAFLVTKTAMCRVWVERANWKDRKVAWISAVKRDERWKPSKTIRPCGAHLTADQSTIDAAVLYIAINDSQQFWVWCSQRYLCTQLRQQLDSRLSCARVKRKQKRGECK